MVSVASEVGLARHADGSSVSARPTVVTIGLMVTRPDHYLKVSVFSISDLLFRRKVRKFALL